MRQELKVNCKKVSLRKDGLGGNHPAFETVRRRCSLPKRMQVKGASVSFSKEKPGQETKKPEAPSAGDFFPADSPKREPRIVHERFLNPYQFVDVSGYTPRQDFDVRQDRFRGNCGTITVDLVFKTPGFIPDPDHTIYAIHDDSLKQEDDEQDQGGGIVSRTIGSILQERGTPRATSSCSTRTAGDGSPATFTS